MSTPLVIQAIKAIDDLDELERSGAGESSASSCLRDVLEICWGGMTDEERDAVRAYARGDKDRWTQSSPTFPAKPIAS